MMAPTEKAMNALRNRLLSLSPEQLQELGEGICALPTQLEESVREHLPASATAAQRETFSSAVRLELLGELLDRLTVEWGPRWQRYWHTDRVKAQKKSKAKKRRALFAQSALAQDDTDDLSSLDDLLGGLSPDPFFEPAKQARPRSPATSAVRAVVAAARRRAAR